MTTTRDVHSFARPQEAVVRHLDLDLQVDFEQKRVAGKATLQIENKTGTDRLYLDSRGLDIKSVELDGGEPTTFELGAPTEYLGQSLGIAIKPETRSVAITYSSRPDAPALQWLSPEQTADGKAPFLLSQSQAILARTWIPCQDSPAVRMTYKARIQVPPGLLALMSASNPVEVSPDGRYEFEMPQPIPSYLLAIAVGHLEFRSIGERTGVYAEPSVVEKAAWELADTEKMVAATEELYGPYRWERYDMIVLPPSFPFGGMENPRLTFLTPTILAGDRSLVSLIAHELAHSWSGNLVTDATWNDFWLNEGVTTYIEHRIMEAVYGREFELMTAVLELQGLREVLEKDLARVDDRNTWLFLDLEGRDPDDGMGPIAYDKGHFFLRMLENEIGRQKWDAFLKAYFDDFAFKSIDTAAFLSYLRKNLVQDKEMERKLAIEDWVYGPGLPENCPQPTSEALADVRSQVTAFVDGARAPDIDAGNWTTQHFLYFIRGLPSPFPPSRLAEIDSAFGFTNSGNSEILHDWLLVSIRNGYRSADSALERFLTSQGRRKFLLPLYRALAATPEGRLRAAEIYRKARPGYHSVSRNSVDEILNLPTASEN